MSDWTPLATSAGEDPLAEAAREARHQVLIELLGAYADRELPPETTSQIDAHLVGCARCRRELAVHNAVRRRLEVEPPVAAPPALRERIAAVIAATPVPAATAAPAIDARWLTRHRTLALVVAGIVTMLALAAGVTLRGRLATPDVVQLAPVSSVPLFGAVLADYRRVTAGDLPGRARDLDVVRSAVPFPVEPLRAPGVRLLAAWTTDLNGDPAAVLAYRADDRVVLEYLVSEERFFQNAWIRAASADGHALVATDGRQGVAAWATNAAGALLVGDAPTDRLARLSAIDLLARRAGRSAQ